MCRRRWQRDIGQKVNSKLRENCQSELCGERLKQGHIRQLWRITSRVLFGFGHTDEIDASPACVDKGFGKFEYQIEVGGMLKGDDTGS